MNSTTSLTSTSPALAAYLRTETKSWYKSNQSALQASVARCLVRFQTDQKEQAHSPRTMTLCREFQPLFVQLDGDLKKDDFQFNQNASIASIFKKLPALNSPTTQLRSVSTPPLPRQVKGTSTKTTTPPFHPAAPLPVANGSVPAPQAVPKNGATAQPSNKLQPQSSMPFLSLSAAQPAAAVTDEVISQLLVKIAMKKISELIIELQNLGWPRSDDMDLVYTGYAKHLIESNSRKENVEVVLNCITNKKQKAALSAQLADRDIDVQKSSHPQKPQNLVRPKRVVHLPRGTLGQRVLTPSNKPNQERIVDFLEGLMDKASNQLDKPLNHRDRVKAAEELKDSVQLMSGKIEEFKQLFVRLLSPGYPT